MLKLKCTLVKNWSIFWDFKSPYWTMNLLFPKKHYVLSFIIKLKISNQWLIDKWHAILFSIGEQANYILQHSKL